MVHKRKPKILSEHIDLADLEEPCASRHSVSVSHS